MPTVALQSNEGSSTTFGLSGTLNPWTYIKAQLRRRERRERQRLQQEIEGRLRLKVLYVSGSLRRVV